MNLVTRAIEEMWLRCCVFLSLLQIIENINPLIKVSQNPERWDQRALCHKPTELRVKSDQF